VKLDVVSTPFQNNASQCKIGRINRRGTAIDCGDPAGIPDIRQDQHAAARERRVNCDGIRSALGDVRLFVSRAGLERRAGAEHAEATREHTFRSITASIARARRELGYAPRYSTMEALRESLACLVANGQVDVGGQPFPPA